MDAVTIEEVPERIQVEVAWQVHGQDEGRAGRIPHGCLEQGFQDLVGPGPQAMEDAVFDPVSAHPPVEEGSLAGQKLVPEFLGAIRGMRLAYQGRVTTLGWS